MMELLLFYFLRDRSLEASIVFQALERKYPDWYEQELTCVPEEIVIKLGGVIEKPFDV